MNIRVKRTADAGNEIDLITIWHFITGLPRYMVVPVLWNMIVHGIHRVDDMGSDATYQFTYHK